MSSEFREKIIVMLESMSKDLQVRCTDELMRAKIREYFNTKIYDVKQVITSNAWYGLKF